MLPCLSVVYLVHFPIYMPVNSPESDWIKKREIKEKEETIARNYKQQQQLQYNVRTGYAHTYTHADTVISILTSVRGESLSSLCSRLLLLIALSPSPSLSLSLSLLLCSSCVCCALCLKQRHTGALMSRRRATQHRSPISSGAAAALTASEATRHWTDLQSAGRQL